MSSISRANAAQVQDTYQTAFAKSMKARIKEEKGSNILDFCEKATVTDAGDYTFYRFSKGDVSADTTLDMYAGGANLVGNAGEAKKYEAAISYLYASDKIKAADLKSTGLDLKSSFVNSMANALKRDVDKKVLGVIDAIAGTTTNEENKVQVVGKKAEALSHNDNVNALIESAVYLSTLARETSVSGRQSVAIVVTAREFAILHKAERILNKKYGASYKFQTNTLFGCEVIKVAESVKLGWASDSNAETTVPTTSYNNATRPVVGQIYLIPNGAIGAASWENDVDAKAWMDDGQDAMFCRAKRSLGVVAIEPESVIRLIYKI